MLAVMPSLCPHVLRSSMEADSLTPKRRFDGCCRNASKENESNSLVSYCQKSDMLPSGALLIATVLSSRLSIGGVRLVDHESRGLGVSTSGDGGGEPNKANVLIPGKAGVEVSLSLWDMPGRLSTLLESFLQRLVRPVRDRGPKTHNSETFALMHRSQDAPESVSEDGTHRRFWARQRSHVARSGAVVVLFILDRTAGHSVKRCYI